jgi:putative Mn2+ efflux pump MntP
MLKLLLFVFPLGLDTFAVAAALGIRGLPRRERLKVSLLMASFEMAMPVVGLLVGRSLGSAIGGAANYVAAIALFGLGGWMLFADEREGTPRVSGLTSSTGLALIGLGISISMDELAIGFTIGLIHLSIVIAVILIGTQAFIASQVGLRVGAHLGEAVREWAERLAALALIALGALILTEKLTA